MGINITSAEFKRNPYPFYARLRAEEPVFPVTLPDKQTAWLVTRYEDVARVLKDDCFAKDRRNAMTPEQIAKQPWMPKTFEPLSKNMLDLDDPDHARLRHLIHKAFTPRLIEQMRERVQSLTNQFLDAAEKKGHMDLIADYALPLPTTIIAEMLGIPARDHRKFQVWSNRMIGLSASPWGMLLGIPTAMSFMRYIRQLIEAKRANPQDDLTSALIKAENDGERLNADELLAMILILLIAGHETTVNLIGNGTLSLLENPAQMEKLRQEPGLIKTAVEELLRYSSPVETGTERYAREDIVVAGVKIPKGALVLAVIASANRDETQFENGDVLDITREGNKHLSFGQGGHYCAGAPLARLEGQIAINTLLARCPQLRLAQPANALQWRKGMVLRGLKALPVAF